MSVADTTKFASAQVRLLPPVNADVSVDVTPAKIRLQASKSYRFQAKVSGTWQERKAGVKWTISPPDRGKIGKDGVYTAPANFPAEASVVVSAISVAVPTKFAESTIALVKDASVDGGSAHAQAKDNLPTESAGALAAASPQQTLTVLTSSSGTPVTPTLEVTSDKATLSEGESARFSARCV